MVVCSSVRSMRVAGVGIDKPYPWGIACLYLMPLKRARYKNRIELLQGTLDLLILQTLQWGPQHGYGIAVAIQANSSDVLQVDAGSLYPALHRLEKQKWIAATWQLSANKQRTRVYRLTAAGRRQLASERSRWQALVDAMSGILARPQQEGK
jgi:PadR family transcriptional regulator, regulatory protein PadR